MKKYWLFILYILIGVYLFVGSYEDRVIKAQFLGRTFFYPITFPVNKLKRFRMLLDENLELHNQIADSNLKIFNLESKLQKFENSLIEFSFSDTNFVYADVIGFSGDFFGRTIVVNKGERDGVQIENPVFSAKGIVGKVIIVYRTFSLVLPLNHSNFKLAVFNKRTGIQGILVADVYSNVVMEYIKFGSSVTIGDTIVTSNLSSVFPANFPVGKIVKLEESPDALYFRAIIQPFNNIGNIQNV
jgi:rod shape-determining protein MreC